MQRTHSSAHLSSLCEVQVSQLANYLKSVGVKKGSDVTIYMPMIPELPAAMVSMLFTNLASLLLG